MEKVTVLGPPGTGKTHFIESDIKQHSRNEGYTYIVYNVGMAKEARQRLDAPKDVAGTLHSMVARKLGLHSFVEQKEINEWATKEGLSIKSTQEHESDLNRFLTAYDYHANTMTNPMKVLSEKLDIPYLTDRYDSWKMKLGKMDYTDILKEGAEHDYYSPTLYLDEAQDLTPLMWKIIDRWSCERRVIVGDDDQAIYSFRGASLPLFKGHIEKPQILDTSYRFGDNVRKAADLILGTARKIQKNYIGIGETEIRRMSWNDFISLDGSKAILVRTNRMAYQLSTTQGAAIFPINKEHSYSNGWTHRVMRLADIMRRFPQISSEEFQYVVKYSPADMWVRGTKARILKQPDIFSYNLMKKRLGNSDIVERMEIKPEEKRNIMMSLLRGLPPVVFLDTMHSVKGMEWDHVLVASDRPGNIFVNDDERRLLYVAATRARQSLSFLYFNFYKQYYENLRAIGF